MIKFVDILIGSGSAPSCRLCRPAAEQSMRDAPDVLGDVRRAADERGASALNLSFSGAEPLAHPDVFELVAASAAAGASRIRLESDAKGLADAAASRRAIHAGVRHLEFGLLGGTAQAHDSFAGSRGACEATLAGVEAFLAAAESQGVQVHVTARVPVCRHNLRSVGEAVALAVKVGARGVTLSVEDPTLAPDVAAPWLESACDTGVVLARWVEVEGLPFCWASGWELHLASNYRHVAGSKAAPCVQCPLDTVCAGLTPGAAPQALSKLRCPPNALPLSRRIVRGFAPLGAEPNA